MEVVLDAVEGDLLAMLSGPTRALYEHANGGLAWCAGVLTAAQHLPATKDRAALLWARWRSLFEALGHAPGPCSAGDSGPFTERCLYASVVLDGSCS